MSDKLANKGVGNYLKFKIYWVCIKSNKISHVSNSVSEGSVYALFHHIEQTHQIYEFLIVFF